MLEAKHQEKFRVRWLHNLTLKERQALRRYVTGNTQTATFHIGDGVAKGLEVKGILYRATSVSKGPVPEFDFNIQPWAYDYIVQDPDLLE